jgi:hypothetical protein
MQVLLRKSDDRKDVQCAVCGQGFRVYWERTSMEERATITPAILDDLRQQHATDATSAAHPSRPFNVPEWSGPPQFSGAALLGGLSGFHKVAGPELDLKR